MLRIFRRRSYQKQKLRLGWAGPALLLPGRGRLGMNQKYEETPVSPQLDFAEFFAPKISAIIKYFEYLPPLLKKHSFPQIFHTLPKIKLP